MQEYTQFSDHISLYVGNPLTRFIAYYFVFQKVMFLVVVVPQLWLAVQAYDLVKAILCRQSDSSQRL